MGARAATRGGGGRGQAPAPPLTPRFPRSWTFTSAMAPLNVQDRKECDTWAVGSTTLSTKITFGRYPEVNMLSMPEAVIVATARSPIGRAAKGSLRELRPDDLAAN